MKGAKEVRYMAGSTSTHSVENINTQNMEQHRLLLNAQVMKHFTILNRASVREIMLRHEKTFKEQVHDLHKLYEVQRLLMHQASGKGPEYLLEASQPGSHAHSFAEQLSELKRQRIFWDKMNNSPRNDLDEFKSRSIKKSEERTNEAGRKIDKEQKKDPEDTPRSNSSPVRKRVIDLEKLPEDDTDDEPEKSGNIASSANMNLKNDGTEFPVVPADIRSESKSDFQSNSGVELCFLLSKEPGKACAISESSIDQIREDTSIKGTSTYVAQYCAQPNLFANALESERELNFAEGNQTDVQKNNIFNGGSKIKTISFMQTESSERILQGTENKSHWLFQASKASGNPILAVSSGQQMQDLSMQPVLPKALFNEAQHVEISKTDHQDVVSRHVCNRTNFMEKQANDTVNKTFQESRHRFQEEMICCASEKDGDNGSKWFPFAKNLNRCQVTPAVLATRMETRFPREHGAPSWVFPAISANSNENNEYSDTKLRYSQNPFMQLSQNQHQGIFQPLLTPFENEAEWLRPSPSMHKALYPQQVAYGIPGTDVSQLGADGMHKGQNGTSGAWNMLSFGRHYSNIPSPHLKPPFKRPPKLVLTNDGLRMELRLASPEESTAKASQEKSSTSFKKVQDGSSKLREQKELTEKRPSITDPNLEKG